MAAYIDLKLVRAGMVEDPAEYRWNSYGEAIGGGNKGNGKNAREGLVRACIGHKGAGFEVERWREVSRIYRRLIGSQEFVNEAFAGARERFSAKRKDGARKMRGAAAAASRLFTARDLRVGVE